MKPLDLTKAPPRSPKVELDGVAMLARTIDKLRASLPGGNMGDYKIPGMSGWFLDGLGIGEDELRSAVAGAESDEDVVRWVKARVDWEKARAVSAAVMARKIDPARRDELTKRYPVLNERSDIQHLADMLDADDEKAFSR